MQANQGLAALSKVGNRGRIDCAEIASTLKHISDANTRREAKAHAI
jgi:hypothetical protein